MIKVKKSFSFLVIVFLVLSNVAFAEANKPAESSDVSMDSLDEELRSIDVADSGIISGDMANIGPEIKVESHEMIGMTDEERKIKERFARGQLSEDEVRQIVKSKLGKGFSEKEFQGEINELRERIYRKEALSYEREGFEPGYKVGPSYEGYSKENMVFAMVFEHIGDDIGPREIKKYCDEPNNIADLIISKLKEKVGDIQNVCIEAVEREAKCDDIVKSNCLQVGKSVVREGASDVEKIQSLANSCPVNKDAIIEACMKRGKFHMEQRLRNINDVCEKRFDFEGDKLVRECERFRQSTICDKDKFMDHCMAGIKKEHFEGEEKNWNDFRHARWQCYDGYEVKEREGSCMSQEEWNNYARKTCEGRCNSDKSKCGLNTINFDERCSKNVACSQDVQQCPDGSYVRRTPPNCNFEACPATSCSTEECEPAPGMPSYLCHDGITQAGPGRCIRGNNGRCGWEIISCPTTMNATQTNPCAGVSCSASTLACPDGFTASCNNNCDASTGRCSVCTPSCEGHTSATSTANRPATITLQGNDGTWCYDSDGNGGYNTRGYCQDTAGTHNDFCDGGVVRDYYCTGTWNGNVWANVHCEHGGYDCVSGGKTCSDGACISSTATPPACPTQPSQPQCASGNLTAVSDNNGCIIRYECFDMPTASAVRITGRTTFSTYDDHLRKCEYSWNEQQRLCSKIQNSCDKNEFIERCKEQEKQNHDNFASKIEQNCRFETISEIKHAEQRCARIDEERQHCLEYSTKRCEQMKGRALQCRELLTEERLRNFIAEEAKKRCKFSDIIQDEDAVKKAEKAEVIVAIINTATEEDIDKLKLFVDNLHEDLKLQDTTVYKGVIEPNRFADIKLMPFVVNAKLSAIASSERAKEVKANIVSRQKVEEAASKLISLRDSGISNEYLYIIEDKASDVLNVSGQLQDIENKEQGKGIGYKIRLFLGLARSAEKEELRQLEDSREKLNSSISVLTKLIDEVPSDIAKSILKEQVENLKKQEEDIKVLIDAKEKKSKGLLGIFG